MSHLHFGTGHTVASLTLLVMSERKKTALYPNFAFINDTHCSHTYVAIFRSPFYLAVNIFSYYKES
jgi:hypothetical protein